MRSFYGAVDEKEHTNEGNRENNTNHEAAAPPTAVQIAVLTLIFFMSLSPHYGKHSLSALAPSLLSTLDIQRTHFGLLFSFQEIPGIILPLVAGLTLTYIQYGPAAIALTSCMAIGQALCAIAADSSSINLMLGGRFVFGLGDSCLVMLYGSIIARWFRYSHLSMAYGIMLLSSRLGSFSGLAAPGFLDQYFGLSFAMWFAVFVSVVSVCAAIAYAALEKRSWHPEWNSEVFISARVTLVRALGATVSSLNVSFALLAILWALLASPFFSLLDYFTDIFMAQNDVTAAHSGLLSGLILGSAAIMSPIFGLCVDRVGRRPWSIATSMLLLSVGIFLLKDTKYIMVSMGLIAVSFALGPVTLLSSVALAVPPHVMPMALGFYKASQNAGLASTHYFLGVLRDGTGDYQASLNFLSLIAACGILVSMILYVTDRSSGMALSKPSTQQRIV